MMWPLRCTTPVLCGGSPLPLLTSSDLHNLQVLLVQILRNRRAATFWRPSMAIICFSINSFNLFSPEVCEDTSFQHTPSLKYVCLSWCFIRFCFYFLSEEWNGSSSICWLLWPCFIHWWIGAGLLLHWYTSCSVEQKLGAGAQSLPPFASGMLLGLCVLIPERPVPSSVKFGSNPGPLGLSWGLGGIYRPPTTVTEMGNCVISSVTFPARTSRLLSLS